MLTPRERMARMARGERPDRVPVAPVVYEHAARLVGASPSLLARDVDLLVRGQLESYRIYGMDIMSVGVDIYNIEAEALGCEIKWFGDTDPSIPAVVSHLLQADKARLRDLRVPDPARDGRMPLFLEACRRIIREVGDEVQVNATIVGPFTLAALLRGFEEFIFDLLTDPPYARELLAFTSQVGLAYGSAFAKIGAGLSINESWITPPLLSPVLFRDFPLPYEQSLIADLKKAGFRSIGLISGGNTLPIAPYLIQTGTSILVADANTDQTAYKKLSQEAGIILRALIDAKLLQVGTDAELDEATLRVLRTCAAGGKFILGCGIVAFDVDPARVLRFKNVALGFEDF
jgi:uroporphyrinogen decarboxylase